MSDYKWLQMNKNKSIAVWRTQWTYHFVFASHMITSWEHIILGAISVDLFNSTFSCVFKIELINFINVNSHKFNLQWKYVWRYIYSLEVQSNKLMITTFNHRNQGTTQLKVRLHLLLIWNSLCSWFPAVQLWKCKASSFVSF